MDEPSTYTEAEILIAARLARLDQDQWMRLRAYLPLHSSYRPEPANTVRILTHDEVNAVYETLSNMASRQEQAAAIQQQFCWINGLTRIVHHQ